MRFDVYHYMVLFLLVTAAAAMYQTQEFYSQIILVPVLAGIADFAAGYYRTRKPELPLSAIISGLIIAAIMPRLDLIVQVLAALLPVAQKHLIRWNGSHIFNPAAFSVMAVSLLFSTAPSWWIAVSPAVLVFLLTANMVRRLPIAVSFYAFHVLLSGASLAALLDYTAVFFALVMAVEPKTTPVSQKGMVIFGAWIAVLSVLFRYLALPFDHLIAALLVMNVFRTYLNRIR